MDNGADSIWSLLCCPGALLVISSLPPIPSPWELRWRGIYALFLLGSQLFEEVVGILDPELCLNSEGGCEDCERDSHTPQKLQYQPEDGKSKETCPRPSAL